MSVLSPANSARSFLSPQSSGYNTIDAGQGTPNITSGITGTYANLLASATKFSHEGFNLSPDELFTKYTVSEVRAAQQRLRADADAKQEELRLMVGERYRDLLQASSSIIAIAKSSQHVLDALHESKEAIASQHDLPLPPTITSIDGLGDRHLSTLQVLSAHMKLLLDAPEHLWRLIERKNYLQAAWLFLLSRVVHRALVQQDDDDEQSWVNEGIDVLTEFPLVQRQWEVVSQFRPQIIHKSTLSLREASSSNEETCATLVTLHLLDSRPLTETLATLLSQRSKTLQSILSNGSPPNMSKFSKIPSASNGCAVSASKPLSIRKVTQTMKKAFNTISQTVVTARTIFEDESSKPSLIVRVLRSMQEDKSDTHLPGDLPIELQITTQSLLTHLTSSANFQLLPANLRSYKPYVDLDSSSARISHAELSQRLQTWFTTSCDDWQTSAIQWFAGLQSIKEVWTLRNSIRRFVTSSNMNVEEMAHVYEHVDSLCHERVIAIWKNDLSDTETKFKKSLHEKPPQQGSNNEDLSSADFLFQPTPKPVLSHTIKSFVDTPFQKYQLSLKRQLVGRSAHLDAVLSTLEQCARSIQQDLLHIRSSSDENTRPLVVRLVGSYRPVADDLTAKIIHILDQVCLDTIKNADSMNLVFLSRVTDDLISSSSFVGNINCTGHAIQDFKLRVSEINETLIEKWGDITVQTVIMQCKAKFQKTSNTRDSPGLSTELLHGLLCLCDYLRQLGIIHHPVKQDDIVQTILRSFITLWIKDFWHDSIGKSALYDALFLSSICTQYGESWNEISGILSKKLQSILSDDNVRSEAEKAVSEYLARTQTLFALLLPPPTIPIYDAPLSRFGALSSGQAQQPTIDLAKPSPRFGMLLVGNMGDDR